MQKISLSSEEVEVRYATWIKVLIDLVKPKNLYLIGGRDVAKSTEILADRAIDIIYDMPRASFAFIADTYVNLQTNILPQIMLGWERKKFYEGYHYVTDDEPPKHWPKPLVPGNFFKHTISTFNGCRFFLKSLDRPSINAGISVAHLFGDEAKYFKRAKLNKVLPTLRGDAVLLSRSHYFMGQTFCTDMPNPAVGEDDWILEMEKKMDRKMIGIILQAALVLNDLTLEYVNARRKKGNERQIENIQRNMERWKRRLRKVRQDTSFFYVVSSLANVDVLTMNYLKDQMASMDFEEFKTAVLSFRSSLPRSERFYFKLSEKNFYQDGYNYDYYDNFGLKANISQSSGGLRYVQPKRPLEAGFDPGNMMSLVIAQHQSDVLRFLKDFYTLVPEFVQELAVKFLDFFREHTNKLLYLHTDRAANQYSKAKEDFGNKLKQAIEYREGKPTGWRVILMSVGARNVEHWQEYNLANEMLEGHNRHLPKILIDAHECKELKSSLEMAPMARSGGKIQKVKKSEKLALERLPLESTNMSDAFKAVVCQTKYLKLLKGKLVVGSTVKVF
ncbi:MAG: hypothetical protein NTU44_04630 [Bacteroidetes bacterium]|nr:hypothetical protein [Bacteroidota bacterium]